MALEGNPVTLTSNAVFPRQSQSNLEYVRACSELARLEMQAFALNVYALLAWHLYSHMSC